MLKVAVPLPPSANALTRNIARGRAKTASYKAWLEEAGYHARMAARSAGQLPTPPLALTVRLGLRDRRRDAGNCLKPIEDMLVQSIPGWPDDRWNDRIAIERDDSVPAGTAIIDVREIGPPP